MRRRARIATSAACGVAAALLAMGGVLPSGRAEGALRARALRRRGGESRHHTQGACERAGGLRVGRGAARLARRPRAGGRLRGRHRGEPAHVSRRQGRPARASVDQMPEGRVAVSSGRAAPSRWTWRGARVLVYEAASGSMRLSVWGRARAWWIVDARPPDASLTLAVYPDEVSGVLTAAAAGALRVVLPGR